MPLFRYLYNKSDNHAQHLDWGYNSVSCEYATVRYSDVEVVNFFFSHSMHSTNFVKKGCGLNSQPLLATQDASGTVRLNVVMP